MVAPPLRHRLAPRLFIPLILLALAAGCATAEEPSRDAGFDPSFGPRAVAFLDTLQRRTFDWFWEQTDPHTGLTPDRTPTESFHSIAATGFALTAYPIGAEHGWITREQARERTLTTLRFLWDAPQNESQSDAIGYQGFFYHFLDRETGMRFGNVELSTVDTALLLGGALFCQSYFDQDEEREIRDLVDRIYARVDWTWAQVRPPVIGHGWKPEQGHLAYDWRGYNEALLLYVLALGSPTHSVGPDAWDAWTANYKWGEFQGQEHLGFAPMFGHQYSFVWLDPRGIQDAYMRGRGIDYFENSRRALLSQHAYALENPGQWVGYGDRLWGLSACDGPVNGTFTLDGRERRFQTYSARGASFMYVNDDGTVTPTAIGGSVVFGPELVVPTLVAMRDDHGDRLFSRYGFLDALNPTFVLDVPVQHGRVHPGHGWYDTDYLGIDQGPILAMLENLRSDLVWRTTRRNAHLVRGLRAAGFTGGGLDEADRQQP